MAGHPIPYRLLCPPTRIAPDHNSTFSGSQATTGSYSPSLGCEGV